MGRGVALQAACRWPQLPYLLGEEIGRHGNHVVLMAKYRIERSTSRRKTAPWRVE
jgi:hypothetical protein